MESFLGGLSGAKQSLASNRLTEAAPNPKTLPYSKHGGKWVAYSGDR